MKRFFVLFLITFFLLSFWPQAITANEVKIIKICDTPLNQDPVAAKKLLPAEKQKKKYTYKVIIIDNFDFKDYLAKHQEDGVLQYRVGNELATHIYTENPWNFLKGGENVVREK
jgi:hypothetical protein